MSIGSSAADVSCQCHKVQKCTGDRGTSVGEWGRGCVNICDPGWAPGLPVDRDSPRASATRETAGRPRPPRGRGMGRGPSRRGVPAPSCRTVHEASAEFSCALGGSGEAWRRGGLERCATARLRSLLSCDAHCVCVRGAGLRTARTGQQGLAGLAEARLHRCLRRKSRLVVTGAQGSGRGGVQCELRRSLARAACTPRTVAGAPV